MSVRYVNPDGVHAPAGAYSHVALAEGRTFAFVAGQLALDADGELVGPGDVGSQFGQAFENLATNLEAVGSDCSQIVRLNTYLVGEDNLDEFRAAREVVYGRYFTDGNYPPNTLLIVSALAHSELKVEIGAMALVPD